MTTAIQECVIDQGKVAKITARNGPYIPERNFAQVFPHRLRDYARGLPLLFHLEHHEEPMALPAYLSALE